MIVEHFGGTELISDSTELRALLKKRYGSNGTNEFYLSGPDRYPVLSILMRGPLA